MDLVCTRCGERWDVDHVLHDEPETFRRINGVILRCPCCPQQRPYLSETEKARLEAIQALGDVLGEDIDGFAATLEDLDLL